MLESCMRPDLVTEITLQPVRRHRVDAAIYYSDIVVPLKAIGVDLDIKPGVGPVVADPIRTRADLARLRDLEPDDVSYVTEAIGLLTAELGATPLIGFAGAPFTLASYLVEGGPSRNHERTKAMMYGDPELWADLLDRLADITAAFLKVQIEAGASAVQLFDSWVGALCPRGLPPLRHARLGEGLRRGRRLRRAAHPLRRRHRRTPRPDGRGGRGRRRRRLAGARSTRRPAGSAPARRSRATSTRPCSSPRREAVEDEGPRGPRRRAGGRHRATSSTSATACCRHRPGRPDPAGGLRPHGIGFRLGCPFPPGAPPPPGPRTTRRWGLPAQFLAPLLVARRRGRGAPPRGGTSVKRTSAVRDGSVGSWRTCALRNMTGAVGASLGCGG